MAAAYLMSLGCALQVLKSSAGAWTKLKGGPGGGAMPAGGLHDTACTRCVG